MRGIFPILSTTFTDEGKLDPASQETLIDFLIEAGAHGLGVFGNASEGYALTEGERRTLLPLILRRVNGRVPVIVSSGHNGADGAVELSREAEDAGAAGLMVLPPFFLKTDGDGLVRYYDAISRAVGIPIMVQDAPLMTQVPMPPALLARMARECERVSYVKVEAPPTAPKITKVRDAAGPGLRLFGGLNGQFMIEEYSRGACGFMPGSDNIPAYAAIWNALESGARDEAWRIFCAVLPLMRFELQPGLGVSAMKHNLLELGVIRSAFVRHPTGTLDAQGLAELGQLRRLAYAAITLSSAR